jgi:hypothetical protein
MKGRTITMVTATLLMGVVMILTVIARPIVVELWLAKGLSSQDPARVEKAAAELSVRGSARSLPRFWEAIVRQLGPDPGAAPVPARQTGGPRGIDPIEPPSKTFRAVVEAIEKLSARLNMGSAGSALLDFLRDVNQPTKERAAVFQSLTYCPEDVFGPVLEEALVRRAQLPEEPEIGAPQSPLGSDFSASPWSFEVDVREALVERGQDAATLRPAIEEHFRRNDPETAGRRLMDVVQKLHDASDSQPEKQRTLMAFLLEKIVISEAFSRGVALDFFRHVVDMWAQTGPAQRREPILQALLAVHDPSSEPSNSALIMLSWIRSDASGPESAEVILERMLTERTPVFWRRYAKSELVRLWLRTGRPRPEIAVFCEDLREAPAEHRKRYGFDATIHLYEEALRSDGGVRRPRR